MIRIDASYSVFCLLASPFRTANSRSSVGEGEKLHKFKLPVYVYSKTQNTCLQWNPGSMPKNVASFMTLTKLRNFESTHILSEAYRKVFLFFPSPGVQS